MGIKASEIIKIMENWVGLSRAKGTHKPIIDIYNDHKPLARGYRVKYTDSYCDTTVSAAFIKAGAVELIGGTECGVEKHIEIFKKKGIWEEDGTICPEPGYLICYNWDDEDKQQPNNGYADHIGVVKSVNLASKTFEVIEGNINGVVGIRKDVPIGWYAIRGYAIPAYDKEEKSLLKAPFKVVNDLDRFNGQYSVNTALNLRCRPDVICKSNVIAVLTPMSTVKCFGDYVQAGDTVWLYVETEEGKMGFASSKYLTRM